MQFLKISEAVFPRESANFAAISAIAEGEILQIGGGGGDDKRAVLCRLRQLASRKAVKSDANSVAYMADSGGILSQRPARDDVTENPLSAMFSLTCCGDGVYRCK